MIHFWSLGGFMDITKFLKDHFFLFKGLSNNEIRKLSSMDGIYVDHFSANQVILDHFQCDKMGIIISGKAIIKSDTDGVIINKLSVGDVYGVASLFVPHSYTTVVMALGDCIVITMNKKYIEKCIEDSHICAINYIEILAEKISFLNRKINAFTAKSAENKLYAFLLQLPRSGNELELNIDMSTIAKMIGVGRATLYRAFDKLELAGTITKKNKIIIFNEV